MRDHISGSGYLTSCQCKLTVTESELGSVNGLFMQCFLFRPNKSCAFILFPELQDASAQQETMAESSNGSAETKAPEGTSAGRDTEKDSDTKRCGKSCCLVIKSWMIFVFQQM